MRHLTNASGSMWESLKLICVMAAMTVFAQYGMANDPAASPIGLEEPDSEQEPDQDPEPEPVYERWLLIYDDYRALASPSAEGFLGLAREIESVRRGDDLYFKGIFKEYPDSWTMCHITDNELLFEEGQLLGETSDGPVYFHYGSGFYEWAYSYPNHQYYSTYNFHPSETNLTISDDGTVIKGNEWSTFWYDDDNRNAYFHIDLSHYADEPCPDSPDTGFMVNMCFKKIGVGGVSDVFGEEVNDATAPMYDLQGRRVNPETAAPGIYIRNGKKIMKR